MEERLSDKQFVQVSEQFVQSFKNSLGVKLTLVESLCVLSDSLKNNPEFLISRYSAKHFKVEWSKNPNIIMVQTDHILSINQIYLKLHEHLQFRLGTILSIAEGIFSKEVEQFQSDLQEVIKKYQSKMTDGISLGEFFVMVNGSQNRFVGNLLEKIGKKRVGKIVDWEVLQEVKKFIKEKINVQEGSGLKEGLKVGVVRENKTGFVSKTEESPKLKNWIIKRLPPKKQPIHPLSNLGQTRSRAQRNFWKDKGNNLQQQSAELQNYLVENHKNKIKSNYDILDLDDKYYEHKNQSQIQSELEHKNFKNKLFIESYIHRYQRKLKRKNQKDQGQRICRSSIKTSKAISRTDNITNFHNKIDSMHNIPSVKHQADNIKKVQIYLQLPIIVPRHMRKTTNEK